MTTPDGCPSETMVRDHIGLLARHDVMIDNHTRSIDTLTVSLSSLNKSFTQIKWSIYGALGLYVLSTLGFIEFIKTVF